MLTRSQSDDRIRFLVFSSFNLLLLVVFYPHLIQLWNYSRQNVHYTHFVLIGPVVAYLIWSERRAVFAHRAWSWAGLSAMLAGLLLLLLAPGVAESLSDSGTLALRTLALILLWVGGFVACFGLQAASAAQFALFFLLFAIPFPESVLNAIVKILQLGSLEVVNVLFKLLPIPVFRQETVFFLPGLTIDVAPECSGIRSSIALVITAALAGHFFLRSPGRRFLLAAAAIPVAIFKNGLRIVTLCLLSIYWDPDFIAGSLHTRGGYPFFVLSLILMVPILWILRRGDQRRGSERELPGSDWMRPSDHA